MTISCREIERGWRGIGVQRPLFALLCRPVSTIHSLVSSPAAQLRLLFGNVFSASTIATGLLIASLAVARIKLGDHDRDIDQVIAPLSSTVWSRPRELTGGRL